MINHAIHDKGRVKKERHGNMDDDAVIDQLEELTRGFGTSNKDVAKLWKMVEAECELNVEIIFNLYEMLKKTRNWDDETLRKELGISEKDVEDIRNRRRPSSEGVGLKMLYGLFPQMAV